MKTTLRTITVFISLCLYPLLLDLTAQISSSAADFRDSLEYTDFPSKDPYFVFHTPDGSGSLVFGDLEAVAPGGTPPYDFTWSRWDTLSGSFQPYAVNLSVNFSRIENLEWGCYRVHITSVDTDTVFRAWVFRNDPRVEVEKDAGGGIKPYKYTCDYLVLNGTAMADTILYYDLATNQALYIDNGMSFEWTSDNDDFEIPGSKVLLDIYIYNDPPYSRPPTKDTRFTLTAVDSFGLSVADEALYVSVHVKAEFTVLTEEEENPGEWLEQENPSGEAPLQTRFMNLSENGMEFGWILVDSAKTGSTDKIITISLEDSIEHTYYYPGYYYPRMIAYSEEGCVDSFPLLNRIEIRVEPSELDVPNVFTPNGDGSNDVFNVKSKSIKNFRITIYNRTGKKVYEHEQTEEKFEWAGWDGTVFGKGNRYAEPGVYYYVIEALGWDAERYRGKEPYKGFVYLYRELE